MLKKVSTFKRTIKFTRPGAELDSTIDDSFVAEFKVLPVKEWRALTSKPGVKDDEVLKQVLVSADDNNIDDVLSDPFSLHATMRTYLNTLSEGVTEKNSGK